ncbi:MAG: DegT/DnrJ/EryC1/StrS family aminotransferase [Ignavibacteriaceae bacterium]
MGCEIKPFFADTDHVCCNLNVNKIETAVTPKKTAILLLSVYGSSSNVKKIQQIADNNALKVIYNARHAFHVY